MYCIQPNPQKNVMKQIVSALQSTSSDRTQMKVVLDVQPSVLLTICLISNNKKNKVFSMVLPSCNVSVL